jgi:hypothetical protein
VFEGDRELNGDDGVGAGRQRGAGHDLRGLSREEVSRTWAASRDLRDHGELATPLGEVLAADGEPVHRRVVEARHSLRRDHLPGAGAAERLEQRHAFRTQRLHLGQHCVERLVDADHAASSAVAPRLSPRSLICLHQRVNHASRTTDSGREA